jgi:glutathione-regulated potassium-efflux system ancillary protein KefF
MPAPHNAAMILLVYAHPHPQRSVAGRALLSAVRDLQQLTLRSLYDVYPDLAIDAEAERTLLAAARLVIWQHPLHWYGPPALLKLWFEDVLVRGYAYGDGGEALAGKDCLWVTTTGAADGDYAPAGKHGHRFEAFEPAVEQTARFCGMNWLEPIVVHGGHRIGAEALAAQGQAYRARLLAWIESHA